MRNTAEFLQAMRDHLQQMKNDLECIAEQESLDDLVYAAGDISDAIAEIDKTINTLSSNS